ncbi:MAG TPA: nucleotidyltransferase domain-containing protein [Aggregatilineales bacterium]|nr:nucleotidyltransferase domain-containing protein [Aggregatilineales bacterium]
MIQLPLDAIQHYCQSQPIKTLSVFGSGLRDDFTDKSDIDLLVQFLPTAQISLFDVVGIEEDLSQLIGWKIDLRTPNELSRYFREEVIQKAVLVYERPE